MKEPTARADYWEKVQVLKYIPAKFLSPKDKDKILQASKQKIAVIIITVHLERGKEIGPEIRNISSVTPKARKQ